MYKPLTLISLLLFVIISCQPENKEKGEWMHLLKGEHAKGWRAYKGDSLPPGWIIKDNMLRFDTELGLQENYSGGKDIIYGARQFDNFELYVEWKLPKGGNSGIFYHIKEKGHESPVEMAPEYQLIDDQNYADIHDLREYNKSVGYTENLDQLQPVQKTAADYAMYPPDTGKKKLNPVGEWNTTRIVFTPEKAAYWLNGKKVVSFTPWSDEWHERKNSGKWKDSPDYGRYKTGYIGFQDHSSPIWFRHVKIREIEQPTDQ